MEIGFIGLGNMGSAIVSNLLKAGHSVSVFNRTREKADPLRAKGALIADSPAAVADNEAVIHMVADDKAVEEIVFGSGNLLKTLPTSSIHISMSTISVDLSKRLTEAHAEEGKLFIAAPVMGRPDSAAGGKLFVLTAGKPDVLKRCQPIFDVIGQKTYAVGDYPPSANMIKLATNFLFASVIESLSEAFALIRKSGIPVEKYLEILTTSVFDTPVYKTYGSLVANASPDASGFKMKLGLKDVQYVLTAAQNLGMPMPVAQVIHDRMVTAISEGFESDWSLLSRMALESAGVS